MITTSAITTTPDVILSPQSATFADDFDIMSGYRSFYHLEFPEVYFSDDVWDFRDLPNRPGHLHDHNLLLQWEQIVPERWILLCKELITAQLNPQTGSLAIIPERRTSPLPFSTLRIRILSWVGWLQWLESNNVHQLKDVTQTHCDTYLLKRKQNLTGKPLGDLVVTPLREIAIYGRVLSETYPIGFIPWGRKSIPTVTGYKYTAHLNATPWIPDDVFNPLLAGALFMVETASNDIINARDELADLRSRPLKYNSSALPQILEQYQQHNIPLPLPPTRKSYHPEPGKLSSKVDLSWLAKQAQIQYPNYQWKPEDYQIIEQTLQAVGASQGSPLFTPVTGISLTDNQQLWKDHFVAEEISALMKHLVASCFIVVASLTGLRLSEILELEKDCIETLHDDDGHRRYRLHGKVVKKRGYGGSQESWMVIEPVATAIYCMERLLPPDAKKGQKLFTPISTAIIQDGSQRGSFRPRTKIRQFLDWQTNDGNDYGLPEIPLVNGNVWSLTTSQFRRTLARQLAYRPHGTLASKIHLKHISTNITEGYWGPAGESAELFLQEIEKQEEQAKLDVLHHQFTQWEEGRPLSGGASKQLAEDFAYLHDELQEFSGTVDQRNKRINELLKQRSKTLHIGLLNDCHFTDPSKARCLSNRGITDGSGPIIPACDPSRCANAVITAEHAPRWEQPILQIENLLTDRKIPKLEKERLKAEKTRLKKIVQPFQGEPHE